MDQPSMTNAEFHERDFESFLLKGEMCLLQGDLISGLDLFDSAIKIDPNDPMIFYRQGLSLFEYGSDEGREKALLLANKKFKHAVALNPQFFDAWQAWGNTLYFLGAIHKE